MNSCEASYPKVELGRMTWPEVKERVQEDPLTPVIVLFSATEQHGPHLPINTDQTATGHIWKKAAEEVRNDVKPVLTPLMPFGVEWEHMAFPGTITLSTRTLTAVAKEIVRSLYLGAGFKKFVLVPGCGGQAHVMSLRMAMCELYEEFGPDIILFVADGLVVSGFVTPQEEEDLKKKLGYRPTSTFTAHGGESETSTALFLQPEDVDMSKARDTVSSGTNQPILPEWVGLPKNTEWEWFMKLKPATQWAYPRFSERGPEVGPVGTIGYATLATAEKGEKELKALIEQAIRFLRWFKKVTLPQGPMPQPKHRFSYKP